MRIFTIARFVIYLLDLYPIFPLGDQRSIHSNLSFNFSYKNHSMRNVVELRNSDWYRKAFNELPMTKNGFVFPEALGGFLPTILFLTFEQQKPLVVFLLALWQEMPVS